MIKLSKIATLLFLPCALLWAVSTFAATQSATAQPPVVMLEGVTNQLLKGLKQQKNTSDKALNQLVNRVLMPHIDLDTTSKIILGNYWNKASATECDEFKKQFTLFIVRTYANALSSYSNQTVRYFPIRVGVTGSQTQVDSEIDQPNGQSVKVSYRLKLVGGSWQVYDFSVENVSIVENYRSQFADTLRTKGLSGLNASLKSQNQAKSP